MFVNAIESTKKAIFPIIRINVDNPAAPTRGQVTQVGSAFFIDDKGTFATVVHAFDNAPPHSTFYFSGCLPDYRPQVEIKEIARDEMADIYLGRVDITSTQFLPLSPTLAPAGRSVCIGGYPPLAKMPFVPGRGVDVSVVRPYFISTMLIDSVTCTDTATNRVHVGFSMQHAPLFGQSGGAVIDADGLVVGMQASVMHPRETANAGRKLAVENAVAISSDKILALYERHVGLRTVAPKIDAVPAAQEQKSA